MKWKKKAMQKLRRPCSYTCDTEYGAIVVDKVLKGKGDKGWRKSGMGRANKTSGIMKKTYVVFITTLLLVYYNYKLGQ